MLNTARKVLIVTGGAGLSFGAAVYRGLKINGTNQVKLIWIIKAKTELPALQMLGVSQNVSVFVTGRASKNRSATSDDDFDLELEDLLDEEEEGTTKDAFELLSDADDKNFEGLAQNITPMTSEAAASGETKDEHMDISIQKGRPVLATELQSFFSEADFATGNNWVVACGPEGLVNDAEKWTKKHHTGLTFHGEKYVM